jgi:prolyl-tRNA synthetase
VTTVTTPKCPTIATLVDFLNANHPRTDRAWAAGDTLKNVVLSLRHPDGSTDALVIGVPGDRDVDLKRIEAQVSPDEVEPLDEASFGKYPALVRGYIGPQVLGASSPSGIRYLLDPSVVQGSSWVTGANTKDTHVVNLVNGRDFTADGTIEAVEVSGGDPCPTCAAPLEIARGIEIGHVFQLGRKYADKLGLTVLDQNGKQVVVTMGSYGIGVSRAVASIAEVFHDNLGLKWPRAISPVDVHIVVTGKNGDDITIAGEKLAAELEAQGLDVLIDDRNGVSPGVKFKDAELIGIPTIVVVGKSLAEGNVEVRDRHAGTNEAVPIGDAVQRVIALVREG